MAQEGDFSQKIRKTNAPKLKGKFLPLCDSKMIG